MLLTVSVEFTASDDGVSLDDAVSLSGAAEELSDILSFSSAELMLVKSLFIPAGGAVYDRPEKQEHTNEVAASKEISPAMIIDF